MYLHVKEETLGATYVYTQTSYPTFDEAVKLNLWTICPPALLPRRSFLQAHSTH